MTSIDQRGAPIPAVRANTIDRLKSTHCGHSLASAAMPDHAPKVTFPRPRRDADFARYGRLRRHDPVPARRGFLSLAPTWFFHQWSQPCSLQRGLRDRRKKPSSPPPLIELGEESLGTTASRPLRRAET